MNISPDADNPERNDYRVVVLKDRLAEAVPRLNPGLPQSAVDNVVHVVSNPDYPILERNNRALHRLYINGVKVEYSTGDGKETIYAQIIAFQNPDNNDLLVVNQFSVAGTKQARRPHVVVFVNGLPLAVVGLKVPTDESADAGIPVGESRSRLSHVSEPQGTSRRFSGGELKRCATNPRLAPCGS